MFSPGFLLVLERKETFERSNRRYGVDRRGTDIYGHIAEITDCSVRPVLYISGWAITKPDCGL